MRRQKKAKSIKYKGRKIPPAVTTGLLFLSCMINAKDNSDVSTCDIPGAFVQEYMENIIRVKLTGHLATLMA